PLQGQEPGHPVGLGPPLIQPGEALPAPGADRLEHIRQPPATGRSSTQDGHPGLAAPAAADMSRPGGKAELDAEGSAAAEAGNPRDAGVIQLGINLLGTTT